VEALLSIRTDTSNVSSSDVIPPPDGCAATLDLTSSPATPSPQATSEASFSSLTKLDPMCAEGLVATVARICESMRQSANREVDPL
jgi:hypothetical protein